MSVRRVGVIGMGLLGRGITACLLAGGLETVVYDRDQTIKEEILH